MVMNERVMQFRIGMFVIVAGLVLTMLIVWFGESPALFRAQSYVTVHYLEAPGVAEGIPVRKSGIRVGEVTSITFDDRPNQPDGVLVTLSLESKYKIKAGSVPRLSRSLIGDVTIDLLPGTGPGQLPTSSTPLHAPVIEGTVAPDPSKALAAATEAFEKVGGTRASIDQAANGIARMTKSADKMTAFLDTWNQTGQNVSAASKRIDSFLASNEENFQPAVANFREVSQKLNATLDSETQAALKSGISQFSSASARLDTSLANASPLFADLGAPVTSVPTTDFGQTLRRMNRISGDLNLLTKNLNDGKGNLNPNGSLQKLILRSDLYDNFNRMALAANETFAGFKPIIASFKVFADKVSRDPSAISRGALQRE
jgi:phospholipid/cholesterol/gamma-HCH transport system substrate-binding protein